MHGTHACWKWWSIHHFVIVAKDGLFKHYILKPPLLAGDIIQPWGTSIVTSYPSIFLAHARKLTQSWYSLVNSNRVYRFLPSGFHHYNDVIMITAASQITSPTIVYSIVYSGADQRKHQSSASLAFVRGSHRAGEFPAQRASNAENGYIWWRHHDGVTCKKPSFYTD